MCFKYLLHTHKTLSLKTNSQNLYYKGIEPATRSQALLVWHPLTIHAIFTETILQGNFFKHFLKHCSYSIKFKKLCLYNSSLNL